MIEMVEKQELNNNYLKYSYEEAEKALIKCQKMITKEIEYISKFTYDNFDELLKMIFENCSDISELDSYIEFLQKGIIKSNNTIERMKYQRKLTKKDIVEENMFNIFGVYGAIVVSSSLSTTDPINFAKTFLILSLIGITSFKINLDYFTSDYRKQQIDNYLLTLNHGIENDRFNIRVLLKMKEMCTKELKYEVIKLYEIVKNNNKNDENYKKIDEFLKGINVEFTLEDIKTKRKNKKNS